MLVSNEWGVKPVPYSLTQSACLYVSPKANEKTNEPLIVLNLVLGGNWYSDDDDGLFYCKGITLQTKQSD